MHEHNFLYQFMVKGNKTKCRNNAKDNLLINE